MNTPKESTCFGLSGSRTIFQIRPFVDRNGVSTDGHFPPGLIGVGGKAGSRVRFAKVAAVTADR